MGVHYFAESAEPTIGSIANVCKPDAISGHRISALLRVVRFLPFVTEHAIAGEV
jgi:hypothetical protein